MTTWTPRTWSVLAGLTTAIKSANKGSGPSEDSRPRLCCVVETTGDEDAQYRSTKSAAKMADAARERIESVHARQLRRRVDRRDLQHAALGQDSPPDTHCGPYPTVVVPQGSESVVIPWQALRPTFYKMAQATWPPTLALTATVTVCSWARPSRRLPLPTGGGRTTPASWRKTASIPWVSGTARRT